MYDNRVAADARVVTHRKAAENLSAGTDHYALAERRMALLSATEADAAQRHAVIDRAVVANNGRLTDHHTHAVVDEDAAADACGRMNFNAGEKAADMAHPTGKTVPSLDPAPVCGAVKRQRVQPRIAENHLPGTESGRVSLENGPHIFLDALKHCLVSFRDGIDVLIAPNSRHVF